MVNRIFFLTTSILLLISMGIFACSQEIKPASTSIPTQQPEKPAAKQTKPKPTRTKPPKKKPTATKVVISTSEGEAVKDLKSGWTEEIIFQNDIISPGELVLDGNGDLLFYDHCRNDIFKFDDEGELSNITQGNPTTIRTIAWQPNQARLIAVAGNTLFALSDGELKVINQFDEQKMPSSIAVNPVDDSFYGCHEEPNRPVNHFDAQGNYLSELDPGAQGCFQIVYDRGKNKVYYSETYAGQVVEIDLVSGEKKVLAQEIGIPGTFEGIAVMLDDQGNLYFYDVINGLTRYQNGQFVQVMGPASGIGSFIYSPVYRGFVSSRHDGGNLILYDVSNNDVQELTPYLNYFAVVEMEGGEVVMALGDELVEVTQSGILPVGEVYPEFIPGMTDDNQGNIYIGQSDTRIYQYSDGRSAEWTVIDPPNRLVYLSNDTFHNAIIATTDNEIQGTTTVWRIPFENPAEAQVVVTLDNRDSIASADNLGNVFILEGVDQLYKFSNGGSEPELFLSSELDEGVINLRAPNLVYSSVENGFVVGTNEYYELWPLDGSEKSILAMNKCGADNFAIHETKDGDLLCVHSGQVFRLKNTSTE